MISHVDRRPGGCRYAAWTSLLGLLLLAIAGCSRAYYRHQADHEVYGLVDCAARDPRWPLEGYTIQPRPESRMFDPDCPDRPPMPPDDPAAHRLMHCVDCKPGWPCWRCYGKTPFVENPNWKAYLPYNEKGDVVVNREKAVDLALLHSREYQEQMETLYLSALGVTFERFRFDTQFFGGNSTFFAADGPSRGDTGAIVMGPGGGTLKRGQSALEVDTYATAGGLGAGGSRLFATGGELVVGMANSLVWQFAGPDEYATNTLLDFSLVQPLLRAGGRAVVLESLTASERALLADIRSLERFRREFYIGIVADYMALLEEQIRILNQRSNIDALQDSYERLEAAFVGGQMIGQTRYQVDLALQSVLTGQGTLLSLNTDYEDQLDAYKLALGLPPELEFQIEDPLLERFNLIIPALTDTQGAVAALLSEFRDAEQPIPTDYPERLSTIREECLAHLDTVAHDFEVLLDAVPKRARRLRQLSTRPELQPGQGDVDPRVCDIHGLYSRAVELCQELNGIEAARKAAGQLKVEPPGLEKIEDPRGLVNRLKANLAETSQLLEVAPTPDTDVNVLRKRLTGLLSTLSGQLLQLSLIQARARLDTITLVPVEMAPEKAIQVAREDRRDWMNARAALVDTWRQIEVAGNDLKSNLDVTFSGDIDTTDNNPVRFRGTTGRLRAGLEFDAPLTRLSERNTYRAALIAYQQARREYYAFEDTVNLSLRGLLRSIRLTQLDFEVNRAAVFVAITRVDLARRDLARPLRPGETSQVGSNAARDLVDALRALLAAQNSFLRLWVDYEIDRLNLDLDLGTMELDSRGMWIDPEAVDERDPSGGRGRGSAASRRGI